MVCLNAEYFDLTKTKQRQWRRGKDARLDAGQGRILWIDAVTKTGHRVQLINIYQHTADRPESQRALLGIVERILLTDQGPKILTGDVNASITGGRAHYALGNTAARKADTLFKDFLTRTQGSIMSTTGPTWKDPYSERTAKLDFAILLKDPTSPRIVTRKQHSKAYVDTAHCTVNTFIHNIPIT